MKAGIIGVGGYGGSHVDALLALEKDGILDFTCFCEVDLSKCREDADVLLNAGKRYYKDYKEMLQKEKLDLVGIPCPIHLHKPMLAEACANGTSVLLEKPPCVAIQDLDEMEEMLEESGCICAVGFQNSVSNSIHYMVDRLNEGVIGQVEKVVAVGFYKRNLGYYNRGSWVGKKKMGDAFVMDGTMNNPSSHLLNAALYLASKESGKAAMPVEVQAELYHANDIEGDDTACLKVLTEEGIPVYYYATSCSHKETLPNIYIYGSKGKATWNYHHICKFEVDGKVEEVPFDEGNLVYRNFEDLAKCIESGNELLSPLSETRAFVLASDGAYMSSKDVHVIGDEYIESSLYNGYESVEIKDIEEILTRIANENKLPSEAGIPWGVKTEKVNVTNLKKFEI